MYLENHSKHFFKGILLEVGIGNSGRLLHFSSGVRIWVGGKCLNSEMLDLPQLFGRFLLIELVVSCISD